MKAICTKLSQTSAGYGILLLRLVVGYVFFQAGAGKLFGWFGGIGTENFAAFLQSMSIPAPLFHAYLVGVTELVGGACLVLGLLTRLVSIPLAITMIVAIFVAHRDGDFYYPLMILMSLIALMDTGAGKLSMDGKMASCCNKEEA